MSWTAVSRLPWLSALARWPKGDLGPTDWADWQTTAGDLLFARDGGLHRQRVTRERPGPARQLVDLSGLAFEPRTAPEWAQRF